MAATGVFERYEKKYLLDEAQQRALREALAGRMQPDSYGRHTICSLYFDTPDYRLIRASIEKPVYKEKLRLRGYGAPAGSDRVFVELKKKYKRVVYKRRVAMPLCEAEAYLLHGARPKQDCQILREVDYVLGFYPALAPRMHIAYDRVALQCPEDPALRITFDSRIACRDVALRLGRREADAPLLPPGAVLMEVKAAGAMPLWLCDALCALGIYPASFSKYGRAYRSLVLEGNALQGGMVCA